MTLSVVVSVIGGKFDSLHIYSMFMCLTTVLHYCLGVYGFETGECSLFRKHWLPQTEYEVLLYIIAILVKTLNQCLTFRC